jgi:hypothetical protein
VRLRRLRFTIRRAMSIVALLALLTAFGPVPLIKQYIRRMKQTEYDQVVGGTSNAILALRHRVPRGVQSSHWTAAVELTATAHFNAFYLWQPPPIEEAYHLRDEIALKLGGSVDIQTLTWMWDQIARTGVDGKNITDRLRPDLHKCFQDSQRLPFGYRGGDSGAHPDRSRRRRGSWETFDQ